MSHLKVKYRGLAPYRFKDNPLERRFALAWQKYNERPNNGYDTLDHLAGDGRTPRRVENDERQLTNTFIQWLGSPVGFSWLMQTLGFADIRTEDDLKKAVALVNKKL